jgi:hypothetical protein
MPHMLRTIDPGAPAGVVFGWLAAALALPAALLLAALGQGAGAAAGGCGWIGVTLPVGRPVWALVNQPTLDFASRPAAVGYWFGSLLLPLLLALTPVPLLPRPRSLGRGLLAVAVAWAAAVSVAWLPLLDRDDSHLARWLALSDLPPALIWVGSALAALAAAPVTLRLLKLARGARPHLGRRRRVLLVIAHLVVPCAAWVGLAAVLAGPGTLPAAAGMGPPVAVAIAVAWFLYPAPPGRPARELEAASYLWLLAAVVLLAGLLWIAGRPLAGGRWAGALWGRPGTFNNIRPWVEARPLPWLTRPRNPDRSAQYRRSTTAYNLPPETPPVAGGAPRPCPAAAARRAAEKRKEVAS